MGIGVYQFHIRASLRLECSDSLETGATIVFVLLLNKLSHRLSHICNVHTRTQHTKFSFRFCRIFRNRIFDKIFKDIDENAQMYKSDLTEQTQNLT